MKGLTHRQSAQLRADIIEYRKQGHYIRECCERFNVKKEYVQLACRGIDFPWKKDRETWRRKVKERVIPIEPRVENLVKLMEERTPGFEYAGGYTSTYAQFRCKECGSVFRKSLQCVRLRSMTCPNCIEKRKKEKENSRKLESIKRQRELECRRLFKKKYKQITMKQCAVCGDMFLGGRKYYCSDKCMKRIQSANHDTNRRIRLREQMVDNNISLEKLYVRDKGECYICGRACDWNDCIKGESFIAGGSYPTIEHIVPLSRGGKHSWENIKLACFSCNTKKGTKFA